MNEIEAKKLIAIATQQNAINIQIVRCLVDAARAMNVPNDSPLLAAIDQLLEVIAVQIRAIEDVAGIPPGQGGENV